MRLINCDTLEPKVFHDGFPEYLILSHRWQEEEATLEGLRRYRTTQPCRMKDHQIAAARLAQLTHHLDQVTLQTPSRPGTPDSNSTVASTSSSGRFTPDRDSPRSGQVSIMACEAQSPSDRSCNAFPGLQKLLDFCKVARHLGVEWVWIDTVCIDKTDSAELAEAINSMYHWYQNAVRCVVYLQDVEQKDGWAGIQRSQWFGRGWTLQELIACREATFFCRDWNWMGTKETLCTELSSLTGIPEDVLVHPVNIGDYNTAQRLSWYGDRETTRPEDQTYCLLGLLEVNMPLLYGEGPHRAFQRMQAVILEEFEDESLLAWSIDGTCEPSTTATLRLSLDTMADSVRSEDSISPSSYPLQVSIPEESTVGLKKPSPSSCSTQSPRSDESNVGSLESAKSISSSSYPKPNSRHDESKTGFEVEVIVTGVLAQSPRQFKCAQNVNIRQKWLPLQPNRMTSRGLEVRREILALPNVTLVAAVDTSSTEMSERSVQRLQIACWSDDESKPREILLVADYWSGISGWSPSWNRWRRIMFKEEREQDALIRLLAVGKAESVAKRLYIAVSWP